MLRSDNRNENTVTKQFVPHDYQKIAIRFLHENRRAGLWMPMGSGKSVTTLIHLVQADVLEPVFPALVLGPKRVIQSTWPGEVSAWNETKHLRVSVVSGSKKDREAALRQPADLYCMAYDNLEWLVAHVGDNWPFITVVADELTRLKSFRIRQGSKRAGALGKVAHKYVKRFIGLTGTPSPNGIKDLWGQSYFIDQGERLGRTFSAFEQRWFYKGYDGYSLVPHEHAQSEIMERVSDIYLTVDSLQVDEPITVPIYVDLPQKAREVYDGMEKEMFAILNDEGVEAANAAVRTQKCLQLANGAIYTDEDGNWETAHDAKLDALESIVEEANGMPVLVAYNFKHDLQRLQARFKKGRVLDADPDTIKQWNEGRIPVLFAHPASAGHGLSLQYGGNIIAFFGVNWNLENHMQIIERIGPMRQKQAGFDRPVYVYPILARNTVDDLVMDRLSSKKTVQEVLIDAMKRRKDAGL